MRARSRLLGAISVNTGKSAGWDNVVPMEKYRRSTHRTRTLDNDDQIQARAYVNLLSTGRVQYGVVGADHGNALSLLEPMLLMGHRLVLIASQ
ncbi:hypothetical protein BCAR13_110091 [Paraburkholderia caribensis]|nr:hypothetical protein BCAR13_110091 [Paraburkholderia caribensis]